jgi:hypothetical protein
MHVGVPLLLLGRNPFRVLVARYRVLAAARRLRGFSAPGGLQARLRMLAIEHALGGSRRCSTPQRRSASSRGNVSLT